MEIELEHDRYAQQLTGSTTFLLRPEVRAAWHALKC